jgi:hypothetical protein
LQDNQGTVLENLGETKLEGVVFSIGGCPIDRGGGRIELAQVEDIEVLAMLADAGAGDAIGVGQLAGHPVIGA